jgi:hypothetical protein
MMLNNGFMRWVIDLALPGITVGEVGNERYRVPPVKATDVAFGDYRRHI